MIFLFSPNFLCYSQCLAIVKYAFDTHQQPLIQHLSTKIDDWILTWNLNVVQQRYLLKTMANALLSYGSNVHYLRLMIKYFQTLDSIASITKEIDVDIQNAVLYSIKSPLDSFTDRCLLLKVSFFYKPVFLNKN